MEITLNNKLEHFEEDKLTISDILKIKNFTFKMLIVKINDKLIKKEDYDKSDVNNGDNVAVIHLISGG